ncbi:MAG: homocysteine S-methyltransferase family protein [Oscillospiraceae bacterium]|nr:homocysteine S-methyltransferase family protein [Oscillospiraceae bacterium]
MLSELLKKDFVLLDGGMGTMLIKRGMTAGQRSDLMNIEKPEVVLGIQSEYASAGSEILCSNSFSSCSEALEGTGVTAEEMITAAISIAKKASDGKALVAVDIGPTGKLLEPYGDVTYEEVYARFCEQATLGEKAGADLAAIETMSDLTELRAAVNAVLENTNLPVFATMTFRENGKTFIGCSVEEFAEYINETPVAAAGMNCSMAPEDMYPVAEKLYSLLKKPMIAKMNAGLPDGITGEYDVTPEIFAQQMKKYKELGVKIVGGCCGTTPDHIKALKTVYEE